MMHTLKRSLTIGVASASLLFIGVLPASAQLTKTGSTNCGSLFVQLYATADEVIKFEYPRGTVRRTVDHGSAFYEERVNTGKRSTSWAITGYGLIDNNRTGARCYSLP